MLKNLYYKIVELLKSIFRKKQIMMLDSGKEEIVVNEDLKNQSKNEFLQGLKANNMIDKLLSLQKDIETETIDESKLSKEEINQLKELYCRQIENLVSSINNYKIKLNT